MHPKVTAKPYQTGDTDHDCHTIKIEHDKPVQNFLVSLK